MPSLAKIGIFSALLFALLLGSGLGRAGVIDIEGQMSLHIRPQAGAAMKGGPETGPYVDGPFVGTEPHSVEFMSCCVDNPEGGPLSYEWDFDYNGIDFNTDASGPGPVSNIYADGPATHAAALRLLNEAGAETIIAESVVVKNVAPSGNAGGPYFGDSGAIVEFLGSAFDPSTADTAAGLIYEWDFDYTGHFNVDQSGIGLDSPLHVYQYGGAYTVALHVLDRDGDVSAISTAPVVVSGPPAPPEVTPTPIATPTPSPTPVVTPTPSPTTTPSPTPTATPSSTPSPTPVPSESTAVIYSESDSWVSKEDPGANNGLSSTTHIQTGLPDLARRSLVRFDLSEIPESATIVSATLTMRALSFPSGPSPLRTYAIHRLVGDWTETVVTWENAPSMAAASTFTAVTPTDTSLMTWDVTPDVQAISDGTNANYGWIIRDVNEIEDPPYLSRFYTREHGTETYRPVLQVTYNPS